MKNFLSLLLLLLVCFELSITQEVDEDYYESYEYRHTISELFSTVETDYMYIDIHCLQGKTEECEEYEKLVKPVIKEIEKIIDFRRPLFLSIFFLDLHYICKKCLSIALPPNYVFLRENNNKEVYSYPISLAKQYIFDTDIDTLPTDFTIALNIDQDIEDIKKMGKFAIAREILHGMGITLTGELANSHGYKLFEEDFYVPQLRAEIDLGEESEDVRIKYKKYYPLNVFEKNIVTQANPNNYIFSTLNDIYTTKFPTQRYNYMKAVNNTNIEKEVFYNAYQPITMSPYYEKTKEIANLFKQKGTVGFRAYDGTVIPLQTFNGDYYRSISVCHIDIPKISDATFYDYDPFNKNEIKTYLNEDFIMNFTYMFAYDADEIADIVSDGKIIGPGVIKILKTMGWPIKGDNNETPEKYTIADDVEIDYDNYLNLALKLAGEHDFYGKGSRYNGNVFNPKVCDLKTYILTMLVISVFL